MQAHHSAHAFDPFCIHSLSLLPFLPSTQGTWCLLTVLHTSCKDTKHSYYGPAQSWANSWAQSMHAVKFDDLQFASNSQHAVLHFVVECAKEKEEVVWLTNVTMWNAEHHPSSLGCKGRCVGSDWAAAETWSSEARHRPSGKADYQQTNALTGITCIEGLHWHRSCEGVMLIQGLWGGCASIEVVFSLCQRTDVPCLYCLSRDSGALCSVFAHT